jgi:hypothetical protein
MKEILQIYVTIRVATIPHNLVKMLKGRCCLFMYCNFSTIIFYWHIIVVQGDILWYLHAYLEYISIRFTPCIILPHTLSPLLRTITVGFIILFSYMNKKHIHHVHPHSPFLMPSPLSLVPNPGKDLFIFLFFIFLSAHCQLKGGLPWDFRHVYCALLRLSLHYLLFVYHHAFLLFKNL